MSAIHEAKAFAVEALAGHIEVMAKHGEPIPAPRPRTPGTVVADPRNVDAVPFPAAVEVPQERARCGSP